MGSLTALGLLAATLASAQQIELVPKLRAGDHFELDLTRIREDSSKPVRNGKSRTPVYIKVLDIDDKSTILDWSYGPTVFENVDASNNPIVKAAAGAMRDLHLEVILSNRGEFQGLRNEAAAVVKFQQMVDTMVAAIAGLIKDEKRRQTIESGIRAMMSPRMQMDSATSDVRTYFGINGNSLAAGKPIEISLGQPTPATFRLTLDKSEPAQLSLSSTTAYATEGLSILRSKLLDQFGVSLPESEKSKLPPMKMSDTGKYTFDRTFGLMTEVLVMRTVSMGGALEKRDGWEYRLTKRPAGETPGDAKSK
jgi:hypothetical protein